MGIMDVNPLSYIMTGIRLVNQVAGGTFLFPLVVLAITLGSIAILIWTVKQFSISIE
jgi:hypothetical protein